MNNMPFFSVIVPVYNCEKYLAECIESVIAQSFCDWELLLIDDGSSDMSGTICDRYSAADARIKVVHKQNGGEFSARKTGVDISQGEYITGLDADDYYEVDHLKDIYISIRSNNADCISFPFRYFGTREGVTNATIPAGKVLDGSEFLLLCISKTDFSFWDKAIRADCYKKIDFSDVPPIRFSEDGIMVIPALCNVESACGMNILSYRYRIHGEAVSAQKDFNHIEYTHDAIVYEIKKVKEAGLFSTEMEKEFTKFFLHYYNARVWELFLANKWENGMSERTDKFASLTMENSREILKDFEFKERLRVNLILKRRFDLLKIFALVYRIVGKGLNDKSGKT